MEVSDLDGMVKVEIDKCNHASESSIVIKQDQWLSFKGNGKMNWVLFLLE